MTTFRINTPVGVMARWIPSLEAAKKVYLANTPGAEPSLVFETSIEDFMGRTVPEYCAGCGCTWTPERGP